MDEFYRHTGRVIVSTIVVAAAGWFWPSYPAIADSRVTILYHEPVELLAETAAGQYAAENSAGEILRFDAFGRRFEILLDVRPQPNSKIGNADFELFTGHLSETPESWVRIMRRGDELSGIVHDQSDTYFIEPRSTFTGSMVEADSPGHSSSVIYRLADALVAPGLLSCDTQPGTEHVNANTEFTKLAAELQAASTTTAAAQIPTASAGIIADAAFVARFGQDSASEMESMFNIVDGIFSAQVGVEIDVAETLIISSELQSPFSPTTLGTELLDELGEWRRLNQRDLALTHLVTDRDLTSEDPMNSIAGLSFFAVPGRSGVCFARSGAGISTWVGNLSALIIAHEIGHNFGAPHDGEIADEDSAPNPCESTPESTFLMSPSIARGASDQFSACSLTEMQKVVNAAPCLSSAAANPSTPASSGGGGALNELTLIILLLITVCRRAMPRLPDQRRLEV